MQMQASAAQADDFRYVPWINEDAVRDSIEFAQKALKENISEQDLPTFIE